MVELVHLYNRYIISLFGMLPANHQLMKTLNLFLAFVFLSLALISLSACQPKKSDLQNEPVKTYYVKGNPLELIQNTQVDTVSPFNESNFSDLNEFEMLSISQFVEKIEVVPEEKVKTQDEIEKENAPANETSDKEEENSRFQIKTEVNNENYKLYILSDKFYLLFKKNAEQLQVEALVDAKTKESLKLKVEHWSVSKNKRYISLLVSLNDAKYGNCMMVITFKKKEQKSIRVILDKTYNYLLGPGVKTSWNVDSFLLEFNFCSSDEEKFKLMEKAIEKWSKHLEGRLSIKLIKNTNCKPFSDLNQHSVKFIDSYLESGDPNWGTLGIAMNATNRNTQEIFDADIFIFLGEFKKLYQLRIDKGDSKEKAYEDTYGSMPRTLAHEFGHALGLDHKFDKKTPSIMSYDRSHADVYEYDVKAIQELYPLKTKKAEKEEKQ